MFARLGNRRLRPRGQARRSVQAVAVAYQDRNPLLHSPMAPAIG